jgi:hypothetical protein
VALAALAISLQLTSGSASAAGGPCAGEDAVVTAQTIPQAERSLLCLLNTFRLENGLAPLAHDPSLHAAARGHCEDVVNRRFFDHTNPDGLGPGERAVAAGYPNAYVGENLAYNYTRTVRALFEQWLDDAPHREGMLQAGDRNAGVGLALGNPVDGPGGPGICGVIDFGSAPTGATDTALDLSPTACARSQVAKQRAAAAVAKQKRRVRHADGASERRRAVRKLKRLRERLADAKQAVAAACE